MVPCKGSLQLKGPSYLREKYMNKYYLLSTKLICLKQNEITIFLKLITAAAATAAYSFKKLNV